MDTFVKPGAAFGGGGGGGGAGGWNSKAPMSGAAPAERGLPARSSSPGVTRLGSPRSISGDVDFSVNAPASNSGSAVRFVPEPGAVTVPPLSWSLVAKSEWAAVTVPRSAARSPSPDSAPPSRRAIELRRSMFVLGAPEGGRAATAASGSRPRAMIVDPRTGSVSGADPELVCALSATASKALVGVTRIRLSVTLT